MSTSTFDIQDKLKTDEQFRADLFRSELLISPELKRLLDKNLEQFWKRADEESTSLSPSDDAFAPLKKRFLQYPNLSRSNKIELIRDARSRGLNIQQIFFAIPKNVPQEELDQVGIFIQSCASTVLIREVALSQGDQVLIDIFVKAAAKSFLSKEIIQECLSIAGIKISYKSGTSSSSSASSMSSELSASGGSISSSSSSSSTFLPQFSFLAGELTKKPISSSQKQLLHYASLSPTAKVMYAKRALDNNVNPEQVRTALRMLRDTETPSQQQEFIEIARKEGLLQGIIDEISKDDSSSQSSSTYTPS